MSNNKRGGVCYSICCGCPQECLKSIVQVCNAFTLLRAFFYFYFGGKNADSVCITFGLIFIPLAIFGMIATHTESRVLFTLYTICVILVFIVGAVILFTGAFKIGKAIKENRDELKEKYQSFVDSGFNEKHEFNDIQRQYGCCGLEGAVVMPGKLPKSCCPEEVVDCKVITSHSRGCLYEYKGLKSLNQKHTERVEIMGATFLAELVMVMCVLRLLIALYLGNNYNNHGQTLI